MSAELIEAGVPRCGECGMPLSMHHDPGCSQPCEACETVRRRVPGKRMAITGCALLGAVIASGLTGSAVFGDVPMGWPAFAVLVTASVAGVACVAASIVLVERWRRRH